MSKLKELQRTAAQRDTARADAAAFAGAILDITRALHLDDPDDGERLSDVVSRCVGEVDQLHRRAAELEQAVEMHVSRWNQLLEQLELMIGWTGR